MGGSASSPVQAPTNVSSAARGKDVNNLALPNGRAGKQTPQISFRRSFLNNAVVFQSSHSGEQLLYFLNTELSCSHSWALARGYLPYLPFGRYSLGYYTNLEKASYEFTISTH